MSKLANEFVNELICLFVNDIVLQQRIFSMNKNLLKLATYNLLLFFGFVYFSPNDSYQLSPR